MYVYRCRLLNVSDASTVQSTAGSLGRVMDVEINGCLGPLQHSDQRPRRVVAELWHAGEGRQMASLNRTTFNAALHSLNNATFHPKHHLRQKRSLRCHCHSSIAIAFVNPHLDSTLSSTVPALPCLPTHLSAYVHLYISQTTPCSRPTTIATPARPHISPAVWKALHLEHCSGLLCPSSSHGWSPRY